MTSCSLLLGPCPGRDREVPLASIADLAELGLHLESARNDPQQSDVDWPDPIPAEAHHISTRITAKIAHSPARSSVVALAQPGGLTRFNGHPDAEADQHHAGGPIELPACLAPAQPARATVDQPDNHDEPQSRLRHEQGAGQGGGGADWGARGNEAGQERYEEDADLRV